MPLVDIYFYRQFLNHLVKILCTAQPGGLNGFMDFEGKKNLLSYARRAVDDFNMIEDGDV